MDLATLATCLSSSACLVTQATGGLIIGMLLFLVAAGLTLIFGVLKVVNFTHGSFYMLGAYFALTIFKFTGSYTLTILGAGVATALVGLVFERLFISRVYGQNVLMQLLVCYGFVLIFDDLVKIIWGPEFKSMGMPQTFQVPPLFIAGGVVPPFYLFVVGMAFIIGLALWLLIDRTRLGKTIRAAAVNPNMVAALGIRLQPYMTAVVMLGVGMAAMGGAFFAPITIVHPAMGNEIITVAFVVVVIGGLGSFWGVVIAALLVCVVRGITIHFVPAAGEASIYVLMFLVLLVRPRGLLGERIEKFE